MGETDEKENVPAGTPTAEIEEPKETEKLLNSDEKKTDAESPSEQTKDKEGTPSAESKSPEPVAEKVNGEEVIDIPEEKSAEKKIKEDGREVKPKKIPIGGIKMPGFFTRKPKPSENDEAAGELLDNAGNEAKVEEKPKDETAPPPNTRPSFIASLPALPSLPKFRNPFAKKGTQLKDEETGDAKKDDKTDGNAEPKAGMYNIVLVVNIVLVNL